MAMLFGPVGMSLPSNEGTAAPVRHDMLGDPTKCRGIDYFEAIPVPADSIGASQTLKCLVSMDERHPKGIGNVLLCQGKTHNVAVRESKLFCASKKVKQNVSNALDRGAPANAEQVLIEDQLLTRGKPGQIKRQGGMLAIKFP